MNYVYFIDAGLHNGDCLQGDFKWFLIQLFGKNAFIIFTFYVRHSVLIKLLAIDGRFGHNILMVSFSSISRHFSVRLQISGTRIWFNDYIIIIIIIIIQFSTYREGVLLVVHKNGNQKSIKYLLTNILLIILIVSCMNLGDTCWCLQRISQSLTKIKIIQNSNKQQPKSNQSWWSKEKLSSHLWLYLNTKIRYIDKSNKL